MDIGTIKELYKTGRWLVIAKLYSHEPWRPWCNLKPDNPEDIWGTHNEYKLIHERHKDVLEAYLADSSVEVEFWNTNYQDKSLHGWCLTVTDFIVHYQDKLEYRLKPQPIDLNNTWCKATEEHKLKLLEYLHDFNFYENIMPDCKVLTVAPDGEVCPLYGDYSIPKEYRQIQLNKNNEWEYVNDGAKIEPRLDTQSQESQRESDSCPNNVENSFNKFGFATPDFGGELLFDTKYLLIGKIKEEAYVWSKKTGQAHAIRAGRPNIYMHLYNLIPLPKPWYEDEANFPKIAMQVNCIDDSEIDMGLIIFNTKSDWDKFGGDYRLLTEEEEVKLIT